MPGTGGEFAAEIVYARDWGRMHCRRDSLYQGLGENALQER